jgi:aminopeptidase N
MRRAILALTFIIFGAALGRGADVPSSPPQLTLSPLPDPVERARFQREELQREHELFQYRQRASAKEARAQEAFDVRYYRLSLDLRDIDGQWIYGDLTTRVQVTAGPLSSVLLDLRNTMEVDSVFVNGLPAGFEQQPATNLLIYPSSPPGTGQTVEIRIYYQGHPDPAGFGAFVWSTHNGTPVIWSLSEPDGAREWWPCKDRPDDKADSLDVLLRVPDWMTATANGLLTEEIDNGDGSVTFHWKHRYPITTYLVGIGATNYVRLQDEYVGPFGNHMLIEHFVYPEKEAQAIEDFSITPEALDAFSSRFGVYPFITEKYGHTLFNWSGGMEHQTNTSYGSDLVRGDHAYDWILVHEMTHQWFGDMISPADWRDVWLNEGFASWGEALWYEHLGGASAYRNYMVNGNYVVDPSGPIYDPSYLWDGNTVYNKGAWVVHMLRGVLGDDLFFDALHEYSAQTAYRSTTTAELQSIFEDVTGQDLDWFFQPWVYGINRPHYEVSFLPLGDSPSWSVAVHLDQVQEGWGFFPMPVQLEFGLAGGATVRDTLWNDPDHLDAEFPVPNQVVSVTVDPDDWILKEVATASYTMNITTTDLPEGNEGDPFETTLVGRGGTPPYGWSVVDALPPGIDLDPDTGQLSGIAPESGEYEFTVRLTDEASHEDDQHYRWTVQTSPTSHPDVTDLGDDPYGLTARPVPAREQVQYSIRAPSGQAVALAMYDLSGRMIRELWSGPAPSGPVVWNGSDEQGRQVPAGVYWARLDTPEGQRGRRIVWLR